MKVRINCPNHLSNDGNVHNKMLMAFDMFKKRFWVQCCDRYCRKLVQVDINDNGGVTTRIMPKNYHLNLSKIATVVEESV